MRRDLDLLQGVWTVTALELEGQKMPAAMLAKARIVIQGNRFTSTGMGADYAGTLDLNGSASPRQLSLKFDTGPEKGNTNLGIYEIDGDTWKLCLATQGSVRPSGFACPPGSGFALETLTRGEASAQPQASPASAAPATEMEGEWRLVPGIMEGRPMEPSMVQWVKRVTRGNRTTVYAGPQVMLEVEFTIDPSQSPKAIDYLGLAGPNRGKTQFGIYEFEGDLLRFRVSAPGDPRPKAFQPGPRDHGTLTVWKRA